MRMSHALLALASAGLIAGGQALAQRGGGHGGGQSGGHGQGAGSARGGGGVEMGRGHMRGGADIDLRGNGRINDAVTGTRLGETRRTEARENSQGAANASPRARARANPNSAIHDPDALIDLTGLDTGMILFDVDGDRVGEIVRINRSGDDRIATILVRTDDGRTIPVFPNTLTAIDLDEDEVSSMIVFDLDGDDD